MTASSLENKSKNIIFNSFINGKELISAGLNSLIKFSKNSAEKVNNFLFSKKKVITRSLFSLLLAGNLVLTACGDPTELPYDGTYCHIPIPNTYFTIPGEETVVYLEGFSQTNPNFGQLQTKQIRYRLLKGKAKSDLFTSNSKGFLTMGSKQGPIETYELMFKGTNYSIATLPEEKKAIGDDCKKTAENIDRILPDSVLLMAINKKP